MTSLISVPFGSAMVVAAMLFSSAAWSQEAGQGPVATACKPDIEKFCAGKPHGGAEVRTCLEAKKSEVSPACKTALDTTGSGKGMGPGMGKGMGHGMGKGMEKGMGQGKGMDKPN